MKIDNILSDIKLDPIKQLSKDYVLHDGEMYNTLKVIEECSEVQHALIESITKKKGMDDNEAACEIGDLIFRILILLHQFKKDKKKKGFIKNIINHLNGKSERELEERRIEI